MKYTLYTLLVLTIFFVQCDTETEEKPVENIISYPEHNSARAFVETFLKSKPDTRNALSRALKPSSADVKAVFADTAIQNLVITYTNRIFEKERFRVLIFPDYTEVHVWTASVKDFENGTGEAIEFPSNFLKVVPYLKEDLIFHRFKFVQGGYFSGAGYDGLIYINGHWVLFPKIWEVLDEF